MKKCTVCHLDKPTTEFSTRTRSPDGLTPNCKVCRAKEKKDSRMTEKGQLGVLWRSINTNTRNRGHTPITYSREDFIKFMYANGFQKVFDAWKLSGFKTNEKPSVDRKDDYGSYSFPNMQVMTWRENRAKACKDRREGVTTKTSLGVDKFSLDEEYICSYPSIAIAARDIGLAYQSISGILGVPDRTAGGFKWQLTEQT